MNTSKNAWDIWNHRIRFAAGRPTIGEFISRLCNLFGLQHLPPEAVMIADKLEPDAPDLLTLLASEHIAIGMQAVIIAKQMKGERLNAQPRTSNKRDDRGTEPNLSLWGREDRIDADPEEPADMEPGI